MCAAVRRSIEPHRPPFVALILSRPIRLPSHTSQLSFSQSDWLVPIVRVFLQALSYNGKCGQRDETPGVRDTSTSSLQAEDGSFE